MAIRNLNPRRAIRKPERTGTLQLDRIIYFPNEGGKFGIGREHSRKIWIGPTKRTFGVKIFLARCARSLGRTESATTRVTTKSIYHQTYEIAKSLYSPRTATADRPRRESASGANTITPFVRL